ncbi:MAG: DEAD/DEAH box helicase [Candidatus Micrarchaeota archaeon]|nr:DEAD/DEAH box helicase [Candidatus Micrarchaeota archaeon]
MKYEKNEASEFERLGLKKESIAAIKEMGFSTPTPIQRDAIPILAQGVDLVAQAQTGSGKTAAFGIHIVEKIKLNDQSVQAIILVPTRELAVQVSNEIKKIAKYYNGFSIATIYGGASINVQTDILKKGAHVVVGTPGRVIDMIKRGVLKLNKVETLVLDEADRMLDMGFMDDVEFIIEQTPRTRQTLLFSATMPDEIKRLASKYMNHPESINVSTDAVPIDKINQSYIVVDKKEKLNALIRILDKEKPRLCIIFTKTKFWADRLGSILARKGKRNIVLHGDLSQSKRDKAIGMFKQKHVPILVATDIAARGLDISGVTHVINYDIPMDPNNYAHRIGRTARAGKEGRAITLVTPEEMHDFKMMQRNVGIFVKEEREGMIEADKEAEAEKEYDEYSLEEKFTAFDLHRIKKEEAGRRQGHHYKPHVQSHTRYGRKKRFAKKGKK